jgi:hypothetical protein
MQRCMSIERRQRTVSLPDTINVHTSGFEAGHTTIGYGDSARYCEAALAKATAAGVLHVYLRSTNAAAHI